MSATETSVAGRAVLVPTALALLAVWYSLPLLAEPGNWSHWDWDKELALAEAQRRAVLDHGEMPLWNPHKLGGTPMLAFHESIVLAPTFPPVLLLGAVPGMKVRMVAGYVIGVLAMWLLCRRWGAHPLAAAAAAVIAMLSGYVASHIWFGQPMWLALGWLPVAMLALHPDRRRPLLLTVAFLAMFLEGGLDILFMAGLLLAVVTTVELLRGDGRGLLVLSQATAGFFLLGSVKVLGTMHFIALAPRPVGHDPGFGWLHRMRGLRQIATALCSTRFVEELPWPRGEWEDMAFIGILATLLGVAGAVVGGKRCLPWTVGVVFCVVIAMDDGGIPGLWTAFHSLPVVEQFEYPLRFLGVGVVPLAGLAALALTRLAEAPWRPAGALAVVLGAAAAAVPLFSTRAILAHTFWNPPAPAVEPGEFFQWLPPHRYMSFPALLWNRGDLSPFFATHRGVRAVAAGSPGYRGEAYLERGPGTVVVRGRTMNRITIEVDAPAPDRLVLNMSHAPGWTWGRREGVSRDGLLSFPVDAGRSLVEAAYLPFDYRLGLFLTLVSSMAVLVAGMAAGRPRPDPDPGVP